MQNLIDCFHSAVNVVPLWELIINCHKETWDFWSLGQWLLLDPIALPLRHASGCWSIIICRIYPEYDILNCTSLLSPAGSILAEHISQNSGFKNHYSHAFTCPGFRVSTLHFIGLFPTVIVYAELAALAAPPSMRVPEYWHFTDWTVLSYRSQRSAWYCRRMSWNLVSITTATHLFFHTRSCA